MLYNTHTNVIRKYTHQCYTVSYTYVCTVPTLWIDEVSGRSTLTRRNYTPRNHNNVMYSK